MTSVAKLMMGGASGGGGGSVTFVDAVQSDGTACIVVPHVQQNVNDAKVRIVFRLPSVLNGQSPLRDKNIFGYSKNDSRWLLNNYDPFDSRASHNCVVCQIYCGNGMVSGSQIDWPQMFSSVGGFHELVLTRQNGYVTMLADGVQKVNAAQTGTPVNGRYGLFTQNDIDGDAVNPIAGRTPSGTPVAEFDTWDGGELVTSLRACIDPNGVACFYDLVSQQYLYSVSGGSFEVVSA